MPRAFTVTLEKQLTNSYGLNTASFLTEQPLRKKNLQEEANGTYFKLYSEIFARVHKNLTKKLSFEPDGTIKLAKCLS
jgi:hypothetical protein